MCATCGCSDGARPTLVALPAEATHGHGHDHAHNHPHTHDHHHDQAHPQAPAAVSPSAETVTLRLERDVLEKNNRIAERNRGYFLGRDILALNLVSSPGAGKTTLLERTLRELDGELDFFVIEGDQATTRDAARIRAAGAPVVQINTGAGCHLEADMVARALDELNPRPGSVVFIENVGNLVCPALFDLGERAKIALLSVAEGDDKPLKYPHMFRAAEVLLLNKVDLLPHVQFDVEACIRNAHAVNPGMPVVPLSATRGSGLEHWYGLLRGGWRTAAPLAVQPHA